LTTFSAVLGTQWLGHFNTSWFGRGALHERFQRRQKKLDALDNWHFSPIIATLLIFLQISLLLFGIALRKYLDIATYCCKCNYGDNGLRIYDVSLHRGVFIKITGLSVPDARVHDASACPQQHSAEMAGTSQVLGRLRAWFAHVIKTCVAHYLGSDRETDKALSRASSHTVHSKATLPASYRP
jgi:Family of unknown function (DUF6535)